MYRYITSSTDHVVNVIDITMFFDAEDDVTATKWVSQDSVPVKDRISKDQLIFYDDFIDTVRSIMLSHFGKIISGKQSGGNYSYYINVDTGINRSNQTTWQFRLRASNHVNPNQKYLSDSNIGDSTGMIFRSIVVGKDSVFKSYHQAIMAIDTICRNIVSGNLDAIAKQFKNITYTKSEYEKLIESIDNVEEYEISNQEKLNLYDLSPDDA